MPTNYPPERYPPPPTYTEPPPPQKKSRKTWILVAVAAALGLLLCVLGGVFVSESKPEDPGPLATTTAPAKHTATSAPKATVHVDQINGGTWKVGTEVKPGTYATKAINGPCYWERLKDFNGELDSIIANGNVDEGEQGRFVVKPTDKGVHLMGPCVWTKE